VFGQAGTITIGGGWELVDASGALVDQQQEDGEQKSYRLHDILNADVTGSSIDPPRSFSLLFATGHRLTVYDDLPNYESFSIYPDGIHI